MKLIRKFSVTIILIFAVAIAQINMQSIVEAAHYYVNSSYTANYRGGGVGLKKTIYIDSDNTGRYLAGGKFVRDNQQRDLKGGLFKVRVIEVWDWDDQKQESFKKDYYFYRFENYKLKEYSVFEYTDVAYTLAHDIPAIDVVMGLKGYGLRCLVPTWIKNGGDVYKDEMVSANDNSSINKYLLKIYYEARKVYGIKNQYTLNAGSNGVDRVYENEVAVYIPQTNVSVLKNSIKIDEDMNLICRVKSESRTKGITYLEYKFFGNNYKNYINSGGNQGVIDDRNGLVKWILNITLRCIK